MRNTTLNSKHKPFTSSGNLGIQTTPVNNRLLLNTEALQNELNTSKSTYLTGIEGYSASKQLGAKTTSCGMFGKNHIRLESLKT